MKNILWIEDDLIKIIPTNSEEVFITDYTKERYELICSRKWRNERGYLRASIKGKSVALHHLILPIRKGFLVDHINRNTADNRKRNLRYLTHSQSGINRKKHALNTSGYTGVYFHKPSGKWCARIRVNGKKVELGRYDFIESAAYAYSRAEEKYYPGIRYKDETG